MGRAVNVTSRLEIRGLEASIKPLSSRKDFSIHFPKDSCCCVTSHARGFLEPFSLPPSPPPPRHNTRCGLGELCFVDRGQTNQNKHHTMALWYNTVFIELQRLSLYLLSEPFPLLLQFAKTTGKQLMLHLASLASNTTAFLFRCSLNPDCNSTIYSGECWCFTGDINNSLLRQYCHKKSHSRSSSLLENNTITHFKLWRIILIKETINKRSIIGYNYLKHFLAKTEIQQHLRVKL